MGCAVKTTESRAIIIPIIYTQRQKLSATNFVAKYFRARLCDVNKAYK